MKSRYIIAFLAGALLLGACASEKKDMNIADGDGVAMLNLKFDDAVAMEHTRAIVTNNSELEYLNSTAKIRIYNSENKLVRLYEGMDKVPSQVSLMADAYMLSVNAGILTHAGFNKPYFSGSVPFIIEKGDVKNINLTCNIVSTLLSVDLDQSLASYFDISTAKVLATTADTKYGLTYTDTTLSKGYFIFSDQNIERNIVLKFTAKTITNEDFEYTYTIKGAKSATEYGVVIKYSPLAKPGEGGAIIDIEIDDRVVNKNNSVQLVEKPRLSGGEVYNIKSPIYFEPSHGTRTVVWITTASQLVNMQVSSPLFQSLFGLNAESFDLCNLTTEEKSALSLIGVTCDLIYNATNSQTSGKLVFDDEFMSKFIVDGEYAFALKATDIVNNVTEEKLNFVVSSATVSALDIDLATVYSNRAQLRGEIVDVDRSTGPYTFKYKAANEDSWISVPATLASDGVSLTASVSGLSPLTAYQYRAVDNGVEGMVTKVFTTEGAIQLPNSGFEYWAENVPGSHTKALTLSSEDGTLYWDCGNHGSNTMSKLVTNPADDARPGSTGSKSSKMVSQFVGIGTIGKFAAGNMFVGRYAATDGTDGVLDFGRPFTYRPSAYKFWFKYAPGKVDKNSIPSNVNVDNIQVGSMDIGKIYVTLGDWDSPYVIKTKNSTSGGGQLFNISDPHIIAYGEYEMKENVSNWQEVVVDLVYRDTTRKPKYIIVCVSASKYGDYFTGGEGSTMYLDDFELIYE